jgi:hypothetical protein
MKRGFQPVVALLVNAATTRPEVYIVQEIKSSE